MNAIEVHNVTKRYGDVVALDELSLAIEPGTTFGLLGTNGAGKSTLFKLLVGHVRQDEGRVIVNGADVSSAGADIRRAVGYLPEYAGFPAALTGREVLEYQGRMRGIDNPDRRIIQVLDRVGLSDAADRRVGGYSNGMTRRLGLAAALLSRPRILLLDEPTAGLDPKGVRSFHEIIRSFREDDGLTVIISSHVLSEIETLCDTVAILHNGRLRATGSVVDLRCDVRDTVELNVRLSDSSAVERARRTVTDYEGTIRATHDACLVIDCPPSVVPRLLTALLERLDVDGYEVHEPGLEGVFENVIPDESEVHV